MTVGTILAAAGGGSSGFGGGGGGGGGFSGGGGGYHGGGGGGSLPPGVIVAIVAVVLVVVVVGWLKRQAIAARFRARRAARDQRVRTASVEAAEDDAAFGADVVVTRASALFNEVQTAWDSRDRERLKGLAGSDLLQEWWLRLDDFERKGWHNRVRVMSGPDVAYVGMENQAADEDDRCVVHIQARLRDYVQDRNGREIGEKGSGDTVNDLSEFWTLGKRDGTWVLESIEQQAEGAHNLDAEIVASPWGDATKLRDESLVEGAVADKALPGFKTSELVDVDYAGDARAQALDLSLADARFGPDVLEVSARRAVSAWVRAVDGPDYTLLAVATEEAARALLYPGASDRQRVVVRGIHVDAVTIQGLDAEAEPAQMTLAVRATGRRYVEDRDTAAVVSGSKERETTFTEAMTLSLSGPDKDPWRLVAAGAGARA